MLNVGGVVCRATLNSEFMLNSHRKAIPAHWCVEQ